MMLIPSSEKMVTGAVILFAVGLTRLTPVFDGIDKSIKYYFNVGSALIVASSIMDSYQK